MKIAYLFFAISCLFLDQPFLVYDILDRVSELTISSAFPLFFLHSMFYGIYAIVCCLIIEEQYIKATFPCHSQHIPRYILKHVHKEWCRVRVVSQSCIILYYQTFSVVTVALHDAGFSQEFHFGFLSFLVLRSYILFFFSPLFLHTFFSLPPFFYCHLHNCSTLYICLYSAIVKKNKSTLFFFVLFIFVIIITFLFIIIFFCLILKELDMLSANFKCCILIFYYFFL